MYEYPYIEYLYYECGLLLTTVLHSKDIGIIPVSIGERAFTICLTSPVMTVNREVKRLTIKIFRNTHIHATLSLMYLYNSLTKRLVCIQCFSVTPKRSLIHKLFTKRQPLTIYSSNQNSSFLSHAPEVSRAAGQSIL